MAQKIYKLTDTCISTAPYRIKSEHRLKRKQIALLSNANGDYQSLCAENLDVDIDCMKNNEIDHIMSYANNENHIYEQPALRCQIPRKHFRRKWATKDTELIPSINPVITSKYSNILRNILTKVQQDVRQLKGGFFALKNVFI